MSEENQRPPGRRRMTSSARQTSNGVTLAGGAAARVFLRQRPRQLRRAVCPLKLLEYRSDQTGQTKVTLWPLGEEDDNARVFVDVVTQKCEMCVFFRKQGIEDRMLKGRQSQRGVGSLGPPETFLQFFIPDPHYYIAARVFMMTREIQVVFCPGKNVDHNVGNLQAVCILHSLQRRELTP
jgi:hypothetical protein